MAGPPAPPSVSAMLSNVIVGVDGSDGGRDAVALAKALAPAAMTLVMAYPVDPIRTRASLPGYSELLREDALRDLEAARLTGGVDADLLAVGDDFPAHALQHVAEHRRADLIVLGSAHHGPLGRALVGDVGRSVTHDAPCPVMIAPKRFRGGTPRRIAVGVDGSPESQAALGHAQRLSGDLGAALTVYVVREDPPVPVAAMAGVTAYLGDLVEQARVAADTLLAETLDGLPARTAGEVLHGEPYLQLGRVAEEHDLMVVGSRRWGAVRRIALGSTSDWLIHHAPCAVLVVPRPEEARAPGAAPERPTHAGAAR